MSVVIAYKNLLISDKMHRSSTNVRGFLTTYAKSKQYHTKEKDMVVACMGFIPPKRTIENIIIPFIRNTISNWVKTHGVFKIQIDTTLSDIIFNKDSDQVTNLIIVTTVGRFFLNHEGWIELQPEETLCSGAGENYWEAGMVMYDDPIKALSIVEKYTNSTGLGWDIFDLKQLRKFKSVEDI
jgi:hypothetical protein